jgi:hypothetical protein
MLQVGATGLEEEEEEQQQQQQQQQQQVIANSLQIKHRNILED